jgi:hypothetical protein
METTLMLEANTSPTAPAASETEKPAATQPAGDNRIRIRAYELFEKRKGDPGGDAESDWYRAEAEIIAETEPRTDVPK